MSRRPTTKVESRSAMVTGVRSVLAGSQKGRRRHWEPGPTATVSILWCSVRICSYLNQFITCGDTLCKGLFHILAYYSTSVLYPFKQISQGTTNSVAESLTLQIQIIVVHMFYFLCAAANLSCSSIFLAGVRRSVLVQVGVLYLLWLPRVVDPVIHIILYWMRIWTILLTTHPRHLRLRSTLTTVSIWKILFSHPNLRNIGR